jgi:hypothetical protein
MRLYQQTDQSKNMYIYYLPMILVITSPIFETVSPTGNVSSSSVSTTYSKNVVGGMFRQGCSTGLWLSMSI